MPRRAVTLLLLLLLGSTSGCNLIRGIAYFLHPPVIDPAEYEFPADAKVVLMLDPARPGYENPVFAKALYDRMVEIFREKESSAQLIAPREVLLLKRDHPDFARWSIRRIGTELKATHVLYAHVDFLQARPTPEYPTVEPRVTLRLKVIAVEKPDADARAWPSERDGREITCDRPPQAETDPASEDAAMMKLGRDTAYLVSLPFFKHDQEEKQPHEK